MFASNKFQKPVKTKFRKNDEFDAGNQKNKAKHHDKSYYRLMKQEREEYDLQGNIAEADS